MPRRKYAKIQVSAFIFGQYCWYGEFQWLIRGISHHKRPWDVLVQSDGGKHGFLNLCGTSADGNCRDKWQEAFLPIGMGENWLTKTPNSVLSWRGTKSISKIVIRHRNNLTVRSCSFSMYTAYKPNNSILLRSLRLVSNFKGNIYNYIFCHIIVQRLTALRNTRRFIEVHRLNGNCI